MFFNAAQVMLWLFVILQSEIITGQNWYTPQLHQVSLPQTLYAFYDVPQGKLSYVSYDDQRMPKNPYVPHESIVPELHQRNRVSGTPYTHTEEDLPQTYYARHKPSGYKYSNVQNKDVVPEATKAHDEKSVLNYFDAYNKERLPKNTYGNEENVPKTSYTQNEETLPKYSDAFNYERLQTNSYANNEEIVLKYADAYNDERVPTYSYDNEEDVPIPPHSYNEVTVPKYSDSYNEERVQSITSSSKQNVPITYYARYREPTKDIYEAQPKPLSTTRFEPAPASKAQNPIADLLLKSVAPNYVPNTPNDIFDFLRDSYPLPNGLKSPLSEYDYIIIGAGSAGCVLASRLTEDPNVTVLVIEAGKPEFPFTDIPSISPFFQRTEYVWPYFMEKETGVCLGMENERCFWPRGKAVGGTSVINYMIYTRGRPEDWDRIYKDGNYGWSYNNIAKYYIKSERANLEGLEKSPHHGKDGNLNVEFVAYKTPLIEAFLESGRILGHPTVDYNAPEKLGFGYVQTTTTYGRRVSAAKAFLHPYRTRPNLHILPRTRTTKILIDPDTSTAYGVQYVRNRLRYEVKARREVILSAGPIASPQLLMLSGVGPQKHLSSLGIPVIQDLPVGRTLYDHITFPGVIFTVNRTESSIIENSQISLRTVVEWLQFGDNVASTPGAVEGIGYMKTPLSDEPEGVPDIELISIGGSLVSDGGPGASKAARKGMMITDEVFDGAYGAIDGTDTWSAFPMLLHPKSKGYLELRDTNPFSHPRMYGNYLTHPVDMAKFIASIRHIQALASTPPFQRFGAKIHRAQFPACRDYRFDTDAYWECAVRTLTVTLHHQIATCRMGPASDSKAVVDPELRVYGVKRLRVVDSSVIPRTVSAHTNAPAIMIGEKAADMIKATWDSA